MGWQDRAYNRSDYGQSMGNPLWSILFGSVPLGTWFGIRVRMHASMVILIVIELLMARTQSGLGAWNAATSMTILFFSVLLHEFGHCFGARYMGGEADEILMWPLGGLAMTSPPHRPWPSFVTTAAGPAVNLIICLFTGVAVYFLQGGIPWYPTTSLRYMAPDPGSIGYYLWWIFLVNYALLTFNLMMAFYPFDGGRMVQEILWWRIGYYKSMVFATIFGMFAAAAVAAFALASGWFMLLIIAVFGFITCYRQRQMLREMGPEEWQDAVDYSESLRAERTPRRPRFSRRAAKKIQKIAQKEHDEQARIDSILDKVARHGMHSLTWWEKRTLKKATERQRQRDVELSRIRGD